MLKFSSFTKWSAALLLITSLSSCEDLLEQYFPKPTPPSFPSLGVDIPFYALSGGTRLDAYSTSQPNTRTSSVAITGLQSGEKLLAMDFRPATGQLYGVGSSSRLYVINQNTGVARAVGAGPFTPAVGGNLVGFDFNPFYDRIDLTTSTGQKIFLNPLTGNATVEQVGDNLAGLAYPDNVVLGNPVYSYGLNVEQDQLYRSRFEGVPQLVGGLNLNISGEGGFDIDARTGTSLGLFAVNGRPTLFTVDLTTGAARSLARYEASSGYTSLAIPTRLTLYSITSRPSGNRGEFDLSIFDPMASGLYPGYYREIQPQTIFEREEIRGLDFRPATSELYFLTERRTRSNPDPVYFLYTLRPSIDGLRSLATFVGEVRLPLGISIRAFTFNSAQDRIHIIDSDGQRLRVNPTDGTVVADAPLVLGGQRVVGSAHHDKDDNLYVTGGNVSERKLYRQSASSPATLTEVGSLDQQGRFFIGRTSNSAYLFKNLDTGFSELYSVNLATGATTSITDQFAFRNLESRVLAVGLGF